MLNFGYKINVRSIFILQQSTLTNQTGCELLRSKDRSLAVAISFHLCLYFSPILFIFFLMIFSFLPEHHHEFYSNQYLEAVYQS